jgi:EAL domain-containing protein (putative c-di-GMP-specific phosphodiesterase class I)
MEHLTFAYQDIVDLARYEATNVELLVRYAHRPLDSASSVLAQLTDDESYTLFAESVRHAQRLVRYRAIQPHVNLSIGDLDAFLQRWDQPFTGITVEICEGRVTERRLHEVIARVHELDGTVALDDLLSADWLSPHLLEHQWDLIKLDLCLWQRKASERAAIIRSLDGHNLCVEGIEMRAQADEMISLGVQWGQGYWFARPAVGHIAPIFDVTRNGVRQSVPVQCQ